MVNSPLIRLYFLGGGGIGGVPLGSHELRLVSGQFRGFVAASCRVLTTFDRYTGGRNHRGCPTGEFLDPGKSSRKCISSWCLEGCDSELGESKMALKNRANPRFLSTS